MNLSRREEVTDIYKYKINEDIIIYKGRFSLYIDKKYKCNGVLYFNMKPPVSICFEADILYSEEIQTSETSIFNDINLNLDFDKAIIDVHGYKMASVTINIFNKYSVSGFINNKFLKSKNSMVEYIDFCIVNFNKFAGSLIRKNDVLFAGRMKFEINDYIVTIDKREDFRKEMYEDLKSKNGTIITHIARIQRKDNKLFRTENIVDFFDDLSLALSFVCGRYCGVCSARGYREDKIVYKLWCENDISPFKFLPNWSDTISNYL
ncbi:MAG: hypothetical protein LBR30_06120, partial [Clostridioides sp.]|nr:hypothetical protein [Clostridioides sp.]